MSRWGMQNVALLAATLLALACAFSSCGGSDSSGSSSSTQAPGEAESRSGEGGNSGSGGKAAENGGSKQGESSGQGGGKRKKASKNATPVAPLHIQGGGSSQDRVKGGDNSVQEFGEESSDSELEEAATVLHDFLVARVRQEWRRACANLSRTMIENLKRLVENEEQNEKISCPAAFAAITPTLPPRVAHESTVVDADSLRVKGRSGFLIYHGFEGVLYAINMAREGRWKVAALAGVPLS